MYISRPISGILIGCGLVALSAQVYAAKGGVPGPPSDSGDNSSSNNCSMTFSVSFRDAATDGLMSDDGNEYPDPDRKDKTWAGGGDGFRFDTNGSSQKLDGAGGIRALRILTDQVPHTVVSGVSVVSSGVDFRFHQNIVPRPTLCSLDAGGTVARQTATIPMILRFADEDGDEWKLLYGCLNHHGDAFTGSSPPVTVTRTAGSVDSWDAEDTWTIEGTEACLITAENYATDTDDVLVSDLPMPFLMTITAL